MSVENGGNPLQAVRQVVARKDIASVHIPEEFGEQVELIVLPVQVKSAMPAVSEDLLRIQEQSGFTAQILADKQEDIWIDI